MRRSGIARRTALVYAPKPRKRQRNTGPTAAVVKRIRERDGWRCVCCGTTEQLTTGHRRNRQMGGSSDPAINRPSNTITQCWSCNSRSESDPEFAERAKGKGWKVLQHQDPRLVRCWVLGVGPVFLLDDFGVTYDPNVARAAAADREAAS